MNQPAHREVLECASPLALSDLVRERKSGRGLPQSKTLARQRPFSRGSWSQCMRQSERRLSMNTNSQTNHTEIEIGGEAGCGDEGEGGKMLGERMPEQER